MMTYRRRYLFKNVFIVSMALLFAQTAYDDVIDLRLFLNPNKTTSAHISEHLTQYLVTFIVVLVLGPWATWRLGSKASMAVGLSLYSAYTVCTICVHWSIEILGRMLVALGAVLFWIAFGCYLTRVGSLLNVTTGVSREAIAYDLFGYCYSVYHLASICNSLMSAYILHNGDYGRMLSGQEYNNVTCGILYCPPLELNNTRLYTAKVDVIKVYTYYGVNVILCVLSVLTVVLCASKLEGRHGDNRIDTRMQVIEVEDKVIGEVSPSRTDCSQLWVFSSCLQMTNRQQLYLIPVSIYSGLQESFYLNHFNQSYVACNYGYWMVVMTTIVNRSVTSLSSIITCQLAKKTGRIPLFAFGTVNHCLLLMALFLWPPNPVWLHGYFIVSITWAIGSAFWLSLLHGFYGVLFMENPEAAFANYYLWKNVGFLMAFLSKYYFCNYVKIFTLISFLTFGMIGYFAVEVPLHKRA